MTDTAGGPAPPVADRDYLSDLLSLSQALNISLDLHEVLERAMDMVIDFVKAERGFIMLRDKESGALEVKAARGIEPEAITGGQEISQTIITQAADEGKPVLSLNAMQDPRFADRKSVMVSGLRSVMCVPLAVQDRIIGVVYVDNRMKTGLFNQKQLEMLSAFANQAVVAIENARLYQELRDSLEARLALQNELHEKEKERMASEKASQMKSEFIAYVSHELRSPLTVIKGFASTMYNDNEGFLEREDLMEFYEAIESSADRLLVMINELLDTSRLEAGCDLQLAVKEIDLGEELGRIARMLKHYKYFTEAHQFEIDVPADLPRLVADPDKVAQVISNFVTNAIKYSPEGGVIRLSARGSDGLMLISVSDQGVGMDPEQAAKLFGRYERIERDDIKNIAGTGLGLYLAKYMVDLHRGRVWAESEKGKGSTFFLELPMQAAV